MPLGKSPGQDGLTTNFYKFFWEDLKDLLFKALKECFDFISLLPTMKQGLIILIPKAGKDKRVIDNLRPITLLNVDYKILTSAIANRLKFRLSQVISETQSGFIKGRLIHNNIRLVLDLIDYAHLIKDDGFILFLDFYKAFDTVEHAFILHALTSFGFGYKFVKLIEMLYKDINSSVSLPGGTSKRFNINRGIRQGDPTSPYLFILIAELLAIYMKNSKDVKPLNVLGSELLTSQLADDTTLFLRDAEQIPAAINLVSHFSKASGLKLNLKKCELMAVHNRTESHLFNIPLKNEVKYLGIVITKDAKTRGKTNLADNITKCQIC